MATVINLIKTSSDIDPRIAEFTVVLKKVSYGAAIAVLSLGILVGGAYAYSQYRLSDLTNQKESFAVGITQEAGKESLLLAIRQRLSVIEKIFATQKNTGSLFTLVNGMIAPDSLVTLSLDENNKAIIVVRIGTIPEAIALIDAFLEAGAQGELSQTSLVSFALAKDQTYELSLSFVPVL